MELPGWAQYVPPPGSRYRVHYAPDGHSAQPDIAAMSRALDARPAVALKGMDREGSNGAVAEVVIYIGDMPLLSVLGTSQSDGSDNFWRIASVERIDSGVPSGLGVTIGKMLDAALDPFQDAGSAAGETARETIDVVKDKAVRIGIPTGLVIGAVVVAFLFARGGWRMY